MGSIEIPKLIKIVISSYCRLGLWHHQDEPTAKEIGKKIVFSIYILLFPISIMAGCITSDNDDEKVFLFEEIIMVTVLAVKLVNVIWKKRQICDLLQAIGVYSIQDRKVLCLIRGELQNVVKFLNIFVISSLVVTICSMVVVPFIGNERKLLLDIEFPMDWKNDNIAFWLAFAFFITEVLLVFAAFLLSVLTWYLMANCALRYRIIGHQIKDMAVEKAVVTVDIESSAEADNMGLKVSEAQRFMSDLHDIIESHKQTKELTDQLYSFISTTISIQTTTSAACIGCSIYCLTFNECENFMEKTIFIAILVYNIFDIFMIMYFGNEIELSSEQLGYCLFESDWIGQPQASKKCIILFGELIRQPHEFLILKLHPLNLATFTEIMNSAYSMFNILKSLKEIQ
ncbi:odorant receptor 94b-like [Bradysia coprophila]|uniref:odorant receptor 94b-like n=1 Tax=Bradysia coprophila TaxID=38358 RepID=UPI00187DD25B|nr:odorant receptor 94b-like [Bradysia coprophila]